MCGIAGILRIAPEAGPVRREVLETVRDAMTSRGPDACGTWIAGDGGCGLGHRRLSILDLSPGGAQPMASDDERYRIVYNGEIYNFREIRARLEAAGERFRSRSDTEVLLRLWMREGVEGLSRLRGMFAFAVWDAAERRLTLARDPYGIKPLYYGERDGRFRFASQVRALHAAEGPGPEDPAGTVGFLLWGNVPEPWTLDRTVRALPAGHVLEVRDGRVGTPRPYRLPLGPVEDGPAPELREAFEEAVRDHLVSDVPVALFLSAGLDSALLAALAARAGGAGVSTFTLRFAVYAGTEKDEGPLAAEVARAVGADHTERTVRREEFLDLWPAALAAMDQPSIDGFNTFVVSRAAREAGYKVALSGLGGDELLGSYLSFADVPRWSRRARTLARIPGLAAIWPALAAGLMPTKPKLTRMLRYGPDLAGAYFLRRGLFLPHELTALLGAERTAAGLAAYNPLLDAGKHLEGVDDPWIAVHRMESTQYMKNQLLRDADWASMAHALEVRVPLVDVRLRDAVERHGFEPARSSGKAALVRALAPELPDALWSRPKSGFSIPVTEWLEDQAGIDRSAGLASRRLALAVLREFGVDVAVDAAGTAAGSAPPARS